MTQHPRYETGVIHGRFQVLHNDHLRYLLAGKALCRHLVVGVTNPDPMLTLQETADPIRSEPLENPLTYYERYRMIKRVLTDEGLPDDTFSVVPLPINLPDRYRYYVPMDAVFFLTIYDKWGKRKQHYFESLGLATHILWEVPPEQKGISAHDIRQRMMHGRPWTHLVPPAVPHLMQAWQIGQRLAQLQKNQ